jgi:hypothetical protein
LVEFPTSGGRLRGVIEVIDHTAWWLRDEEADAS